MQNNGQSITFEQMPILIGKLNGKIDEMQKTLASLVSEQNQSSNKDKVLTVSQLQDKIEKETGRRPARQTIYQKVCDRKIPFKKFSKYLGFVESEIDQYLDEGGRI